jgi:hypothetical protein
MANFDHSVSIDLRKPKQRQENPVYNTETWMPELVTFDIVTDPGFRDAMMRYTIVKDPSRAIILDDF